MQKKKSKEQEIFNLLNSIGEKFKDIWDILKKIVQLLLNTVNGTYVVAGGLIFLFLIASVTTITCNTNLTHEPKLDPKTLVVPPQVEHPKFENDDLHWKVEKMLAINDRDDISGKGYFNSSHESIWVKDPDENWGDSADRVRGRSLIDGIQIRIWDPVTKKQNTFIFSEKDAMELSSSTNRNDLRAAGFILRKLRRSIPESIKKRFPKTYGDEEEEDDD